MAADYRLRELGGLPFVYHYPSSTMIPLSDPNSDLGELVTYNEWLAAGNTPDPDFDHAPSDPVVDARQFWTQLAVLGHIDEDEAVEALEGDLPNGIKQFINGLPNDHKFAARTFFLAPTFRRQSIAITHTKAIFALDDAAVDQFFIDAALL
jgi:hypothetical protein